MPPATPVYFQRAPAMSPVPHTPRNRPSDAGSVENNDAALHEHHPSPSPPRPLFRIHLDDLSDESSTAFLSAVSPATLLEESTATVLKWLYDYHHPLQLDSPVPSSSSPSPTVSNTRPSFSSHASRAPWPPVRSVTLVLRPMSGVAYTTGLALDDAHKEVHLSLAHVAAAARDGRLALELAGVAVHESVHVWQAYEPAARIPGGLVEGVADWVRLRAGLVPPHWRREAAAHGRAWDDGYEVTAWFLDWLERHAECGGAGTVRRCNAMLRRLGESRVYDEAAFWTELCGKEVQELWDEYGQWLEGV